MDETEALYSGMAVGGPLDGKIVQGRFPGGIVFVSKPTNKAWIYDFYPQHEKFYSRPIGYDLLWDNMSEKQKLQVVHDTTVAGIDSTRELDSDKIVTAAEGSTYEVRALPEEGDE
jgi:hypothetical protein